MARKKTTPEEIKSALKKEIIRLGIEDNPSRTVYQKQYERGTAPSPNNAVKITGMKWQDLMQDIGFDYDGKNGSAMGGKKSYSTIRATRYNYDDPEVRKEIMDRVVMAIRNNGYTKPADLKKNLRNTAGVAYSTITCHGFTWEGIAEAYKEKYGEPIVRNGKNERTSWNQFSNKELLDIVTNVVVKYNLSSVNEYRTKFLGVAGLPNILTLNKRFGTTDKELWRMIQINGDLPIK